MRTLLRHGLDHYEVLRADEPLRRGERPVAFHDPGAATAFLERLARSGDGERELRRLAREDFADELAGGRDSGLLTELGRLLASRRLKLVRSAPAVRLRSGGVEYVVLERGDRPRRHESLVKVWDETSAHRFARLIAWLPPADRNRVLATAAPGAAWSSQRDVARAAARGLASGAILVARVRTLREAGASAPPPAAAEVSTFGWRDAASFAVGFVPIVGDAVDIIGAAVGKDLITGEALTLDERLVMAGGTVLGSGKGAVIGLRAAKAGLKAVRGVPDGARFAQRTYREIFDEGGAFAGKSIDDVSNALRTGKLKPEDVPIDYITRDGNPLILNTRSAQALERAGIPRSQWNGVDRTGQGAYEARLTGQLQRNKLTSEGTTQVRPSGK